MKCTTLLGSCQIEATPTNKYTAKGLLEEGVNARDLKPPFPLQSSGHLHQDFPRFFITCLMGIHSNWAWSPSTFRSTCWPGALPFGSRCGKRFLRCCLLFNCLYLWRSCISFCLSLRLRLCTCTFSFLLLLLFVKSLLFLVSFSTDLFLASWFLNTIWFNSQKPHHPTKEHDTHNNTS